MACILKRAVNFGVNCPKISSFRTKWFADFKSSYSLDKIYPSSDLNIAAVQELPKNDGNKFSGYIPIDDLRIKYIRSSGPGGQNVNKVNTKTEVRFQLSSATWIPEEARTKMAEMHKGRLTKEGYFVVTSDKTRSQAMNLTDCLDKLRCMIREATKPPPEVLPETRLMLKARQEKAAAARLRQKRIRSQIKRNRHSADD